MPHTDGKMDIRQYLREAHLFRRIRALPGELRDEIIKEWVIVTLEAEANITPAYTPPWQLSFPVPTSADIKAHYYYTTAFKTPDPQALHNWLTTLKPEHRGMLTEIRYPIVTHANLKIFQQCGGLGFMAKRLMLVSTQTQNAFPQVKSGVLKTMYLEQGPSGGEVEMWAGVEELEQLEKEQKERTIAVLFPKSERSVASWVPLHHTTRESQDVE